MKYVAATVLALVITAFPTVPASAAEDPVAEARAAIEAANGKFSEVFARGDAAALSALYTFDAMLLPPGEDPVRGNASIG
jgi:ketosteroid isomerase-like protein